MLSSAPHRSWRPPAAHGLGRSNGTRRDPADLSPPKPGRRPTSTTTGTAIASMKTTPPPQIRRHHARLRRRRHPPAAALRRRRPRLGHHRRRRGAPRRDDGRDPGERHRRGNDTGGKTPAACPLGGRLLQRISRLLDARKPLHRVNRQRRTERRSDPGIRRGGTDRRRRPRRLHPQAAGCETPRTSLLPRDCRTAT